MSVIINHPVALSLSTRPLVFVQYIAAIAVAEAVQGYSPGYEGVPIRLKWPNDICKIIEPFTAHGIIIDFSLTPQMPDTLKVPLVMKSLSRLVVSFPTAFTMLRRPPISLLSVLASIPTTLSPPPHYLLYFLLTLRRFVPSAYSPPSWSTLVVCTLSSCARALPAIWSISTTHIGCTRARWSRLTATLASVVVLGVAECVA